MKCRFVRTIVLMLGFGAAAHAAAPSPVPAPSAVPPAISSQSEAVDLKHIRDPFKQPFEEKGDSRPLTEIEQTPLDQIKMVGVLTGPTRTRVMMLAPSGKTFVMGEGDRIGPGNGIIKKILRGRVIVTETRTDMIGDKELVTSEISLVAEGAAQQAQPKVQQTVEEAQKPVLPPGGDLNEGKQ